MTIFRADPSCHPNQPLELTESVVAVESDLLGIWHPFLGYPKNHETPLCIPSRVDQRSDHQLRGHFASIAQASFSTGRTL